MRVTVITVCFNSRETIVDTLRSVASQTWFDVEHLVIDGGSTDGTQALVHQHGRTGHRMISERDAGIYDAMNKGVRLASGDIIAFLNADDFYVDSSLLAKVVSQMSGSAVDALYGDTEFVRPGNISRPIRRYRSSNFRPHRVAWGWMPAHPALFMRRRIFELHGPFRIDYRIAGDFEFIARVSKDKGIVWQHVPEIMVRMRTGGVSTSGWRSTRLLNQEVLRACRENGIYSNWLMILSKYPLKLLEYLRK